MNKLAKIGIIAVWFSLSGFGIIRGEEPDDYELFRREAEQSYNSFKEGAQRSYSDFREAANKEYAAFMSRPWTPIKLEAPIILPRREEPKPPVIDYERNREGLKPRKIEIDSIYITPREDGRPTPPSPIIRIETPSVKKINLTFYGTPLEVTISLPAGWRIGGREERQIAEAWQQLAAGRLDNMLADCLEIREQLRLPDWGYFQLIERVAKEAVGNATSEQALLMGFMLHQSGYKIRYALDSRKELILMFACEGYLFGRPQFYDGEDTFYTYQRPAGNQVVICKVGYPKERRMSMGIREVPRFSYKEGNHRSVTAHGDKGLTATVVPNKNLMDFYADYPDASVEKVGNTKWLIHANTPASEELKNGLYPVLRKALEGKRGVEAVEIILDFAQSFPYGYDDKIWGRDRAFWPDESWEYPFSDCEDHAIQFTRLVRDLTGLETALVYYPGHLAAAVALPPNEVRGDYFHYNGKKYVVCDPTYFYAGVGRTLPDCDNSKAVLLPLE